MTSRPAPGTRVVFRWRKWDGSPHWEHDCLFLGSDEWGDWLGQWTGARSARPGREMPATGPDVTLMSPSGEWAATFNPAPHLVRIYIDIATEVGWSGGEPVGIDMDLDVVRAVDDRGIFIDDRDEWEEHAAQFGYPADLMARLEQVAVELERRVTASVPPFDDATPARWLDALAVLSPDLESKDD